MLGTPLSPLWKCWDLFVKNWPKDFWKWHYFLLQKPFILTKWGFLQKKSDFTELWTFLSRQYFFKNFQREFKIAIKSSILNFWLSSFAWDLQLCIFWRWFHQNPKNLTTKRKGGRGGGMRNIGEIKRLCLIGLRFFSNLVFICNFQ